MDIIWDISEEDIGRIKLLVRRYSHHEILRRRRMVNIAGDRPAIRIERFWHALTLALLTTQQRSGPGSAVKTFLSRKPYPLAYKRCQQVRNVKEHVADAIREHGGIRRVDTIAENLACNLAVLLEGEWRRALAVLKGLETHRGYRPERKAARYFAATYNGLGPKQSRNLLQFMGLTRYEIPLDSRVAKWLNNFGFPLQISPRSLSDPDYYELALDGVQALCKEARVLPCILDAAIFVSFDEQGHRKQPGHPVSR